MSRQSASDLLAFLAVAKERRWRIGVRHLQAITSTIRAAVSARRPSLAGRRAALSGLTWNGCLWLVAGSTVTDGARHTNVSFGTHPLERKVDIRLTFSRQPFEQAPLPLPLTLARCDLAPISLWLLW